MWSIAVAPRAKDRELLDYSLHVLWESETHDVEGSASAWLNGLDNEYWRRNTMMLNWTQRDEAAAKLMAAASELLSDPVLACRPDLKERMTGTLLPLRATVVHAYRLADEVLDIRIRDLKDNPPASRHG